MSEAILPFIKSPIRILRVLPRRLAPHKWVAMRSRWVSRYRETILHGLKMGLTKTDLLQMLAEDAPFASPICNNSQLLKIRLRLAVHKLALWTVFGRAGTSHLVRQVLRELSTASTREWHPSQVHSLLGRAPVSDNYELVLVVIPSPYGFDWSSPRKFAWSLRNYLAFHRGHKIGHAAIVFKKNGEVVTATGMTGETNYFAMFRLLFAGGGLDVIFRTYRGRLECKDALMKDIEKHRAENHIREISYSVDRDQFERCLSRLHIWGEQGKYQFYGLNFDVPSSEGASCTSYAIGYLHEAGILTDEHYRKWRRELEVCESLHQEERRRVGASVLLYKLLFQSRWQTAESKTRRLRFWDPDLMSEHHSR